MKKTIKKLAALLLAGALAATAALPAFAAGDDQQTTTAKTYTITNKSDKHSYEIYQIFTGNYDTVSKQLQNLKYGKNAVGNTGDAVSAADLAKLAQYTDKGDTQALDQQDLAFISEFVTLSNPYKTIAKDATDKTVSVEEGFYLIKDVDGSLSGTNEPYTLYLTSIIHENTDITPKAGTTTSEKKVDDINDSTGTAENMQDSADYDIGDYVPYHLKATIASNVSAYKKYHLTFTDTLEAGKFDNITAPVIKVDGIEISKISSNDYSVTAEYTTAATAAGFKVTVTFLPKSPATLLPTALEGKDVTIDFTAQLGEKANIGQAGNVNTLVLKYSNNPNSTDDKEEGTAPEDTVIVFTYDLIVDKTDEDGNALEGASFALYKKYTDDQLEKTGKTAVNEIKYDSDKKTYTIPDGTNYVALGTINGTNKTQFVWSGVDDGDYLLVETVAPKGYNALDPKTFSIKGTHTKTADIDKTTKKDGSGNYVLTSVSGTGEITLSEHKKADGTIDGVNSTIKNQSGTTLPSTGGMGTTIFYVIGGILVLAAAIILISRRRVQQ